MIWNHIEISLLCINRCSTSPLSTLLRPSQLVRTGSFSEIKPYFWFPRAPFIWARSWRNFKMLPLVCLTTHSSQHCVLPRADPRYTRTGRGHLVYSAPSAPQGLPPVLREQQRQPWSSVPDIHKGHIPILAEPHGWWWLGAYPRDTAAGSCYEYFKENEG